MNLTHVLSWGSSFTSLSSLECRRRRRRRAYDCGEWQKASELRNLKSGSSSTYVAVIGANDCSRRSNGYTSSSRSLNTVNIRPKGRREQYSRCYRSSNNWNSEGSREGFGSHGEDDTGKNATRDFRDSERRYGGEKTSGGGYRGEGRGGERGRGRGRGGAGGPRAGRRDREKQMHPGAYQMRDEQTGDMVVVWGVEDDDDIPMPTAADLNWRKATVALPGDASYETWTKLMEQQSGSLGTYRVKGAEPERQGWTEDLFDEEPEDDFEDNDILDDEDDSDSDSEELTEIPKVAVSRAPKVKVFGRDLWGKSQLKVKTQEEKDTTYVASDTTLKSEAASSSSMGLSATRNEGPLTERTRAAHSGVGTSPSDTILEKKRAYNSEHNSAEDVRRMDLDDDVPSERRRPPKMDHNSAETSMAMKLENISSDQGKATEIEDKPAEWSRATKIEYKSLDRTRAGRVNDRFTEERSKGLKLDDEKSAGGKHMALQIDNEFTEGRINPSSGSFNPYILDISEGDCNRSQHRQQDGERTSSLLDRLRLQVSGQKPKSEDGAQKGCDDAEKAPSLTATSWNKDKHTPNTSSHDSVRTPMRDLTARDNYDASIANEFFSLKTFKDVGASPEVIQALSYLHVQRPSQIQAMAFKPIVEGKSCIIAEQTGSGKTLAYVAPIVQRLKADEARTLAKSMSKKPRVLVLVPTGELAAQVLSNFRSLSKGGVPCRSIVVTGGFKWKTQVESLLGGADVVVATPGRLLQQLEAGNIQFNNLESVVLDEVDILFDDENFSKALQTINKAASIKVQYIHVTATLPVDIHDNLLERYPDCLSLMGPSLHHTAIGLQEVLVDCSGGEADDKTPESAFVNKRAALLQLVEERPVAKTIIFCNKMETCRKVENVLSRYDRSGKRISVLSYHAALSQETRLENLEIFLKAQPNQRLFLVCTDRASRGIDSLDVEHVVLFDFPRDPSEYVRRVGRTARGAGGTGKVFAFVVGRQVGHARRIMARNDKGEPVHDVPGSRYYYTN